MTSKIKPRIYFLADSSTQTGLNHFLRSMILANILEKNFNCFFLVKEVPEALQKKIEEKFTLIPIPRVYESVQEANYIKRELICNDGVLISEKKKINSRYGDVLKNHLCTLEDLYRKYINFRKASENDMGIYFQWVNDRSVRENSFQTRKIIYEDHERWFLEKIKDENTQLYFFEMQSIPMGQVRIEFDNKDGLIDCSVDKKYRGLGLGKLMIEKLIGFLRETRGGCTLKANVKKENEASIRVFKGLNFQVKKETSDVCGFFIEI